MYDDYLRTLLRLGVAKKAPAPDAINEENPLERKMSYSAPEEALESSGMASARRAASPQAAAAATAPKKEAPAKPQTYVKDKNDPFANVGRNDPCPCGSGLKYKKCHGR